MPVSAKMRLGYSDDSRAVECALAIAEGGAGELVVHARTKAKAYQPPAYWERIADIRQALAVPVIANGDIWTADDARRFRKVSGCNMLMIGRGAVRDPGLGLAIQADMLGHASRALDWSDLRPLITDFWRIVCARLETRASAGRLKQWLNFLRRRFPEAEEAYQALKIINDPAVVEQWLLRTGEAPVAVPGVTHGVALV